MQGELFAVEQTQQAPIEKSGSGNGRHWCLLALLFGPFFWLIIDRSDAQDPEVIGGLAILSVLLWAAVRVIYWIVTLISGSSFGSQAQGPLADGRQRFGGFSPKPIVVETTNDFQEEDDHAEGVNKTISSKAQQNPVVTDSTLEQSDRGESLWQKGFGRKAKLLREQGSVARGKPKKSKRKKGKKRGIMGTSLDGAKIIGLGLIAMIVAFLFNPVTQYSSDETFMEFGAIAVLWWLALVIVTSIFVGRMPTNDKKDNQQPKTEPAKQAKSGKPARWGDADFGKTKGKPPFFPFDKNNPRHWKIAVGAAVLSHFIAAGSGFYPVAFIISLVISGKIMLGIFGTPKDRDD